MIKTESGWVPLWGTGPPVLPPPFKALSHRNGVNEILMDKFDQICKEII